MQTEGTRIYPALILLVSRSAPSSRQASASRGLRFKHGTAARSLPRYLRPRLHLRAPPLCGCAVARNTGWAVRSLTQLSGNVTSGPCTKTEALAGLPVLPERSLHGAAAIMADCNSTGTRAQARILHTPIFAFVQEAPVSVA